MISHGPGGFLGAMALLTDTPYRGTTQARRRHRPLRAGRGGAAPGRVRAPRAAALLPAGDRVGERGDQGRRAGPREAARRRQARGGPRPRAQQPGRRRGPRRRDPARVRAPAPGGLRRDRRHRRPGRAARRARLPRRPGDRADRCRASRASTRWPRATASRRWSTRSEQRGIADAYDIASVLTEARLGPEWVDRVAAGLPEQCLAAGLRFVGACAGTRVVLAELEQATTRVADLVGAVRSYSYLDQAPRQTVDVHEGLESTLVAPGPQAPRQAHRHRPRARSGAAGHRGVGLRAQPGLDEPHRQRDRRDGRRRAPHAAHQPAGRAGLRRDLRQRARHPRARSRSASSTPSSPPRRSGRAPASASTSPSASSCATTASCASSPNPAILASR